MNFDFSDEQKELGNVARRYLADRCPSSAVRAILEGRESYDRNLYSGLAEMGFLGAAMPATYGGSDFGYLELCVIAEELGRVGAPVPVSSSIYLAAEFLLAAGGEEQKKSWLPRLASGEAVGTFALAEKAGRVTSRAISLSATRNRLNGSKIPVPYGDVADMAVVAARDEVCDEISLFLVDMSAPGISREAIDSVDPTRSQARVSFSDTPAEPLGKAGEGWKLLTNIMDRAAVLTAFEQIGGAERALEMATAYAKERIAFGRPIGSFQAIKHMLADMFVAATLAKSNAYYGAWALSTDSPDLPVAAASARVSAIQAFQICSKNNIQVHGGIGFTWEVDCHLYYRRSNALAVELGSLSTWEDLLIGRMKDSHDALKARAPASGDSGRLLDAVPQGRE